MKKAKIMLLTIAVIATVGTALAFKVNKFGSDTYCYLTTSSQPEVGECTNEVTKKIAISGTGIFYKLKTQACNLETCDAQASSFGQ
jgi:hypothetical protein